MWPGTSAVLPGGMVTAVSCASSGNCSAGGHYGTGFTEAFIVNETHGTWGKAEAVPGLAALNRANAQVSSVSCTAVGDCTAGGDYDSSNGYEAFVVDEKDGTWGAAHPVPHVAGLASTGYDAEVMSVSCASPGNCTAGGWAQDVAGAQAFVVDETGGTWGSATEVPGSAALNVGADAVVNSVSCTAVGDCTVGGFYAAGPAGHYTVDQQAFVADETGGIWGDAHEVPGTAALNAGDDAQVTSVSCASPGDCAASGTYSTTAVDLRVQAPFQRAFVVNETDGTWGKAESVPGTVADPSGAYSVSCASPGDCVVGGVYHGDMGRRHAQGVPRGRDRWHLGCGAGRAGLDRHQHSRVLQRHCGVLRLRDRLRRGRFLLLRR